MLHRNRISPGSRAGLQAWIVSSLFHALLLTLFIPLFQHLPRMADEPFHWTISLVEPFDPPSDETAGPSTPMTGADQLMPSLMSESHPIVPSQPSTTASHEGESGPQLLAAVQEQPSPLVETARGSHHFPALQPLEQSMVAEQPIPSESHAILVPQPAAAGLADSHSSSAPVPALEQQTALLPEVVRHPDPPAALAEPVRPQEVPKAPATEQASEPTRQAIFRSSDQPIQAAPPASHAPSAAEAPAVSPPFPAAATSGAAAPVVPVTRSESPPRVAARLPDVSHGSSIDAGEPGPIRKDDARLGSSFPESSAQTRPQTDYGWLQQALFRRLEELKRSSRLFIDESGRMRVLVRAVVSSTGELMEAEIVKSSGHHRIDQEAMTLVHRAFPMSLDRDLERSQIVMRIPITFSRD